MIWKPHVTVAAIVEQQGRFLIVEEIVEGQRVYNQPAGHLDPGESLIDAVVRETREETGWQFVPEALVSIQLWRHPTHGKTFLRFTFCGDGVDHDANAELDTGIIHALWLSRDELMDADHKLRSPMVMRSIDDYLRGYRYSLDILEQIDTEAGR
jgi:8-oxo-dGTP pyrophosphatase MutT (NUDIX family)